MGTMTRIEKMPREQFDKLFSLAYWYGLQPKFINLGDATENYINEQFEMLVPEFPEVASGEMFFNTPTAVEINLDGVENGGRSVVVCVTHNDVSNHDELFVKLISE